MRPGDVLLVDGRASVQFAGSRAMTFRVTVVGDQPTYHGWIWLTGYALDRNGRATARREIYVQHAGLRQVLPGPRKTNETVTRADRTTRVPRRQARV